MTQVIDFIGGEYRNRTGVHGFAIRCVTTPPTRHPWCWVSLSLMSGGCPEGKEREITKFRWKNFHYIAHV